MTEKKESEVQGQSNNWFLHKIKLILIPSIIVLTAVLLSSCNKKSESKVNFANLTDGQEVTSPVTIEMAVEGMEVRPAGEVLEGTGHFHIYIDADEVEEGVVVPTDEKHIHFGDGRTSTELELSSGEHKLVLQFADGIHRAYGKDYTKSITVNVQ